MTSIAAKNEARLQEEKRNEERKKHTLVLIINHLLEYGYSEAADKLQAQSGVSYNDWDVADNIDLLSIIQEYEVYFQMKFNRKPKLARKRNKDEKQKEHPWRRHNTQPNLISELPKGHEPVLLPKILKAVSGNSEGVYIDKADFPMNGNGGMPGKDIFHEIHETNPIGLIGRPVVVNRGNMKELKRPLKPPPLQQLPQTNQNTNLIQTNQNQPNLQNAIPHDQKPYREEIDSFDAKLLKPLPDEYRNNSDMKELASIITRDIFMESPNVRWKDIAGLDEAKKLLKEAVVMPVKYPDLFTGLLQPWKGVLLFGPPGTGKTMLAKAVATECKTTFFNISASTLVSKWRGDSEKLIRCLFDLARYHSPSTIFLDEIDALMSQRGDEGGGEHEASRRMKTELLIQMDGLARSQELVFVLAVSNLPWTLDTALLRRLEKRIFVALPSKEGRIEMFKTLLPPSAQQSLDYQILAEKTQGYSGSDIHIVCKESAMSPLRRLLEKLEKEEKDVDYNSLEPVSLKDVEKALERTKPSAQKFSELYQKWKEEYGSL